MKPKDENYIQYRQRVMDPISNSFCAAKWLNATIWLGNGATASCHLPPAHKIPLEEIEKDPSALHNTLHKKVMRAQMLRGERPSECDYCWKIEDLGKDHMSDRTFKTSAFSEHDIQNVAQQPARANSPLRTLEISFDRTCQFACSYCNAGFSTRWGSEINQNGPYQNLMSDGAGAYQHTGSWAAPYPEDGNPYVQAFWKWWPDLSSQLDELRVTGGEPFLSKHTWALIERMKIEKPKFTLAINSNLGFGNSVLDRIITATQDVQQMDIYTSCESIGTQAEYIRDGLNYEQYLQNVERLLKEGRIRKLNFMITATVLSLGSLDLFLRQILRWKKDFPNQQIHWMINILRFPSFMSPLVLPKDLRLIAAQKLRQAWMEFKQESRIEEFERESLSRLISYIEEVDKPHAKASEEKILQADFKSFFEQYDRRRDKNFIATFPEWKSWFNEIKPTHSSQKATLVNGDHSSGWHDTSAIQKLAKDL